MDKYKRRLLYIAILLIPILSHAQVGRNKYILSTGDTTLVVNRVSGGLRDKDAQFLFERDKSIPRDSAFLQMQSKYRTLEEAALEVNRLREKVAVEKAFAKEETNDALSFRLSQLNRRNMKKEQIVSNTLDSLFRNQDIPENDLMKLYSKFGNKPTFYINGVEVPEKAINSLLPTDILKRTMRVTDTASGNPNGEVWFDVSDKGLERLQNMRLMDKNDELNDNVDKPKDTSTSSINFYFSQPDKNKKAIEKQGKEQIIEEVEIKIKQDGKDKTKVKAYKPNKPI